MRRPQLSKDAGLALTLDFATAKAEECSKPLPDFEIATAEAGVPEAHSKFLGVWGNGKWDGYLCNRLVVKSVDSDGQATVIYGWGIHPGWSIMSPGFRETNASVKDDVLTVDPSSRGGVASYRFNGGSLDGEYVNSRGQSFALNLERISR